MRHWRESRRGAALAALCLLGLAGCGGAFSSKQEPLPGERRALRAEASAAAESSAVGGALGATRSRADAPQLQGDAAHSGGHLAGPAAPRLSWTAAAVARSAQGRVAAAPVVAQGRIYALGAEADIAAMNAGDGHVIWRADLSPEGESGDDGHGGGLAFADGRLYATTGFGELLALDGASGDILWRAPLGAPARAAPVVSGGRVVAISRDNVAHGFDAASGAPVWTDRGAALALGVLGGASPAIGNGVIALPYAAGELAGANLETGRRVWVAALIGARRTETRGAILDLSGGPVIRDGRVYAANQSGELSAFDLRSGRKIWARPIGMTQPVWPAGDSLFALDANGALLRLSARDGATIWRAALPLWRDSEDREDPIGWSGPVAAGGAVHIVSTLGELLSFDAATGAQTARAEAPSGVAAPPVIAGGTLYLLGMDGRLSAWR